MSVPCRIPFLDLGREMAAVRAGVDAAMARVLDRGHLLLGPELAAFEEELAAWCGGGRAVGVASGMDAIDLLLRAHGIGPGDDVLVPANTCLPTWLGVSACGARPVGVDPDPATRNLAEDGARSAWTARTRAVMGVHLYGLPCDVGGLGRLCRERGVPFLVDAAQSVGACWEGSRVAAFGDGAALSFYPTKNLGALGDAGAVWTPDDAVAAQVRLLRNYGMRNHAEPVLAGRNSRLEEIHAAVLRVKLPHLEAWTARRETLAGRYQEALGDIPGVRLPRPLHGSRAAWHLYVVEVPGRDAVAWAMGARGVGTAVHYPVPPPRSPVYRGGCAAGAFPVADRLADEVLSLPLNPFLRDDEAAAVVEAFRAAVEVAEGRGS